MMGQSAGSQGYRGVYYSGGYQHAGLLGHRVDSLIPDRPREARPGRGTAFAHATMPRPAGTGARLAGAREDGARFPVEVRSATVHTPAAEFTLTVIRDVASRAEFSPPAALESSSDVAGPRADPRQAPDETGHTVPPGSRTPDIGRSFMQCVL
jgi:hypothetical protein